MTKITHDFYQTKTKVAVPRLLWIFALLLMSSQTSWGQFTSSFFTDGGIEGQSAGSIGNVTGTSGLDTSKWRTITATSTTGLTTSAIVSNAGNARSGAKYLSVVSDNTNTGVKIVHPRNNNDATRPKLISGTAYVVQFYYKPSVDGTIYSYNGIICPSGATSPFFLGSTVTTTVTSTGWIKAVSLVPASTFTTTSNASAGIFIPSATVTNAFYDDYVIYAGTAVDDVAPDAPASLTVDSSSGTQNVVTWTAPGTGVDGGGYLLVRYLGDPSADSDPNVNGVYSYSKLAATVPATAADMLANTINKGSGPVDGVVVYSGTALTYTDVVASPSSYYYKIYTVDKAFNYSAELKATGGLSSPTLATDMTDANVDNLIDITFTDDATWRGLVSAVKINGTNLTLGTDYDLTSGNLQLKPSGGNTLLTTAGSKSIAIIATGYVAAAAFQVINAGALVPANCTVTLVSGPLAPSATKTMNCTAKDQYNNGVSGYQFKYDATIANTNVATAESYTIDGTAQTATANDVNLVALTNASGLASFTITLPSIIDGGDGVSVQVQLSDGTTNVGFAASYTQTTTTWDGSIWSNSAPSTSVEAIINGTYSTTTNGTISAKKLTVNATKSLTINSTTNVTVQNEVINNGSLVVENNANLIQVNNTTNTGNVIVNRNSNDLYRLDYTMWSSPVVSQNLAAFSPLTSLSPSRFYTYDSTAGTSGLYSAIADPTTTNFSAGTGYLIRMPNDASAVTATAYPGVFTGIPNNGNVSLAGLTSGLYYAVGNPYPSTISAESFLAGNSTDGILYFWRKTNAALGSAYATYTLGGATTTTPTSAAPNGTIQVGQGFIVKTTAATLDFANTMRAGSLSTQFFKTKQVVERNRVWLNLTSATGVFSQALVAYMTDATQGVDAGIDGEYINDSPVALTSNINDKDYTIQGRALPFDPSDVVALNFKTDVVGDYTIAIDHADGLFATGQDVYLVDNTTGKETNLKTDAYTFTATAGADNARFALKYQKTLKIDAPAFNDNSVTVYKNKGTLYINSGTSAINNVKVFDIQGRLIAEQKNVKANSIAVKDLKATQQVLIIKVTSEDNKVVNKKVAN